MITLLLLALVITMGNAFACSCEEISVSSVK